MMVSSTVSASALAFAGSAVRATLLAAFLAVSKAPASEEVVWLAGVRLPASAVVCHVLEELPVHGFDMATPTNRTWRIAPAHAALAIEGAAVPIVTAAGPTAFVHPERAQGFHARFDVRLRGHQRRWASTVMSPH